MGIQLPPLPVEKLQSLAAILSQSEWSFLDSIQGHAVANHVADADLEREAERLDVDLDSLKELLYGYGLFHAVRGVWLTHAFPVLMRMRPNAWSIARSPADWLKILEALNVPMGEDTFSRRRKDGTYRQHPESTTKAVRLALDCLPAGYSDSMKA